VEVEGEVGGLQELGSCGVKVGITTFWAAGVAVVPAARRRAMRVRYWVRESMFMIVRILWLIEDVVVGYE